MEKLNPWKAIAFNVILPGAGYWYTGRRALGVVVGSLVIGPLAASLIVTGGIVDPVANWCGLVAVVGAVDCFFGAKKRARHD